MAQLVALMSGVAVVVGSNLARGKSGIFLSTTFTIAYCCRLYYMHLLLYWHDFYDVIIK